MPELAASAAVLSPACQAASVHPPYRTFLPVGQRARSQLNGPPLRGANWWPMFLCMQALRSVLIRFPLLRRHVAACRRTLPIRKLFLLRPRISVTAASPCCGAEAFEVGHGFPDGRLHRPHRRPARPCIGRSGVGRAITAVRVSGCRRHSAAGRAETPRRQARHRRAPRRSSPGPSAGPRCARPRPAGIRRMPSGTA